MEILRPIAVLLAFFAFFLTATYLFRVTLNPGWRFAVLAALVLCGVLVWLITETLSLFKAITLPGLAGSWGMAGLILAFLVVKISRRLNRNFLSSEYKRTAGDLASLPKGLLIAIAYLIFVTLVLGLTAFIAAPNTWDSMTYHLSRVLHWQQNQSLDFYPTAIQRQLHFGPFAEMGILNFQVLAGYDRLANFIQTFAMIGCVLGTSLIVKMLGGKSPAQVLAALSTITIPMGILQSTSTQNDYVVGLWIVCFTVFVLDQINGNHSLGSILFAGASLGLGILTKATAILYAAPIGLWLAFELFQRFKINAWKPLVILLSSAILINVPQSIRNYGLYHNPVGPSDPEIGLYPGERKTMNDVYSAAVTISNILRNTSLELAWPSDEINRFEADIVKDLHKFIQLDVNDRRITYMEEEYRVVFSRHEARAANPFQMLVILISLPLTIALKKKRVIICMICNAAGFLLFCFLFKWQPWNNRLLLPLLVLAMPATAIILSNVLSNKSVYIVMLMMASIATLAYLFLNPSRPLIGPDNVFIKDRLSQYFMDKPELFVPYKETAEVLTNSNCERIGIVSGYDDWEYPIWVMIKGGGKDVRIEDVFVENISARLETGFNPCAILSLYPLHKQEMIYKNNLYIQSFESSPLSIFLVANPSQ